MQKRNMPRPKRKTKAEILKSPFITQTETGRLLDLGYSEAKRVFQMARDRDLDQIGEARMVHVSKVRLTSVLWVVGIDYDLLMEQVKGGESGEAND